MLEVGIAFDLRPVVEVSTAARDIDDLHEEYDSRETIDALAQAIADNGHAVRLLGGGREFVRAVLDHAPDLVFNVAEGWHTRGREAHVPSVCELLELPFTHSDPTTMCVTLDKEIAKTVVRASGLATPASAVVTEPPDDLPLRYPLIAKPLAEGSSVGIHDRSRLDTPEQLLAEVERLTHHYRQPVLVEEFCGGAEFTVGIVGNGSGAEVIGVMEVVPADMALEDFVYSVAKKRLGPEAINYVVPPRRPAELVEAVSALALGCYAALGCRDIARIDIRLDAAGTPQFLEANPMPGLKPGWGDIVILAEAHGIPHVELVGRIVDEARARYGL